MIYADPLHVLFLGIVRDFVTSVLLLLLTASDPIFMGRDVEEKEHSAFLNFLAWCRTTGKSISIDKFGLCVKNRKTSAGYSAVVKGKAI